ncbi:MAG: hypothetical protein CW338_07750 [Clostridiales bacterium]|nr:hypothetical protein [Clostridiales bacterium]
MALFLPCMVCCAYLIGGGLSMMLEIVSGILAMYMAFGAGGAVIGAIFTVIPAVVFMFLCERDVPFHKMVIGMMVTYLVIDLGMYVWLKLTAGGDIARDGGDAFVNDYLNSGLIQMMSSADSLAQMLRETFGFSSSVPGPAPAGGLLTASLQQTENVAVSVHDSVGSVRLLAEDYTLSILLGLPGNIIYTAVIAAGASQHFAQRSNERALRDLPLPDTKMPPLRQWYIPRQWGAAIGLFAVGIVLRLIFSYEENPSMYIAGSIFFGIFEAFYVVQGVAVINDMQHRRGRGRFACFIIPVLIVEIVPFVAMILGVIDQWKDMRGLRGPKTENENKEEQ